MKNVVFAIILSSILVLSCSKQKTAKNDTVPQEPAAETVKDPMASAQTLPQAIECAKPYMADAYSQISKGAALLGLWSAKNMKWNELCQLPASKYSLIMKDPDLERGKMMSVEGYIIEILAQPTDNGKVYTGGLFTYGGQIYRFIAVGSTGELVANSYGKFKGVVIGKYDYPNSQGGTAHSVHLVGMFDLPENK